MKPNNTFILAINGGSSSIKFAFFRLDEQMEKELHGKIDRIGQPNTILSFVDKDGNKQEQKITANNHKSAANAFVDWLEKQDGFKLLAAVGHRVVHGMNHTEPETVTQKLLGELHRIVPFDPDHLPSEIELIEVFQKRYPKLPQVACFDTAFHAAMPKVAKLLPIPRRYFEKGVQRYGFHGLSYAFIMQLLEKLVGPHLKNMRIIVAHLGSGASMVAIKNGKSIDTTMAFTPAAGLIMGSRSGDIDPGLVSFLLKHEKMTASQYNKMVNHESGLIGISETSTDMRDLIEKEQKDERAADAVALFCYQAKKYIGAYAAALGGLDMVVFTGGIGENSPIVRERICEGLGFLGIELDVPQNKNNAGIISKDASRIVLRVIHTDEELMIAKSVNQILGLKNKSIN